MELQTEVGGRKRPPMRAAVAELALAPTVQGLIAGPCRIAITGMGNDPLSVEFVRTERLLAWGFDLVPVHSRCGDLLGNRCYERLVDVPGSVDVLLVLPTSPLSQQELAAEAIEKGVNLFWVEDAPLERGVATALAAHGIAAVGQRSLQVEVALQRC